jgi:hypothetical protein
MDLLLNLLGSSYAAATIDRIYALAGQMHRATDWLLSEGRVTVAVLAMQFLLKNIALRCVLPNEAARHNKARHNN